MLNIIEFSIIIYLTFRKGRFTVQKFLFWDWSEKGTHEMEPCHVVTYRISFVGSAGGGGQFPRGNPVTPSLRGHRQHMPVLGVVWRQILLLIFTQEFNKVSANFGIINSSDMKILLQFSSFFVKYRTAYVHLLCTRQDILYSIGWVNVGIQKSGLSRRIAVKILRAM